MLPVLKFGRVMTILSLRTRSERMLNGLMIFLIKEMALRSGRDPGAIRYLGISSEIIPVMESGSMAVKPCIIL